MEPIIKLPATRMSAEEFIGLFEKAILSDDENVRRAAQEALRVKAAKLKLLQKQYGDEPSRNN